MRLTDFDTEDSPKLPQNFINNMKHTSDFDDMSVPYFDRLAVLVMEGIATPEERAEYAKLLSVSEKNQESASIYSKCRLRPDDTIQMPDAQGLKRQGRVIPLLWKISSAVAVLALGWFGLTRYYHTQDAVSIHGLATSTVTPIPREVLSPSADTQVFISANGNKTVSANTIKTVSANGNETVSADTDENISADGQDIVADEMIVSAELPTKIPIVLTDTDIEIPEYLLAPSAESKQNQMMAFFRKRLNRLIDAIPSPVEIVRDENDEVAEVSFVAFNRTITYRRPL